MVYKGPKAGFMVLKKSTTQTSASSGLAGYVGPGVFFISFAVYLNTLAPTVTFWDSGELIFGAATLGNPHPPSYPLFCQLGKLFYFIPLGNAAFRVNLMSAFFAAATAYLLFRLLTEMGSGRPGVEWAAAGMALSFAFIRNLWSVSVVSEVYSLNAFLLVATVYLLLLYDRGGRHAYLHASAFVLALALVNHQSTLMFMPAYAAYYLSSGGNYKRPAVVLQSLSLFVLAYSVMLYLPVRAAAFPVLNIGDARYVTNFLWLIKWPEDIPMIKERIGTFASKIHGEWLFYFILASAACGYAVYLLRRKRYLLMLSVSALLYFIGTSMVTAPDTGIRKWGLHSKFFVPVYLFIGLTVAYAALDAWGRATHSKRPGPAWTVLLALLCLSVPAAVLAYNYREEDNSRNFIAHDFASNTLKSVSQDAAIFAWGDNGIFPVWYLQGVEHFRDDVFFMHTGVITYPWYMADRVAVMDRKYGIKFAPPSDITDLDEVVRLMRLALEGATPTYFDYSAVQQLGYKMDAFKPQGLVHLSPAWQPAPLGRIWGWYVLRGVTDNTTNKAFAAEGIMDIYAWECALWAQEAYNRGSPEEALKAYGLAKDCGMSNPYMDQWADDIRQNLIRRGGP